MDMSNSKCSEMEQALDAYLDLELDPAEAQAVESHLESCPACTVRLKEIEALVERLQSLPAPVLSRDLADSIGDRILSQKTTPAPAESSGQVVDMASARRARNFTFSRPLAYAASFILVALAGSYLTFGVNLAHRNGSVPATQIASTQVSNAPSAGVNPVAGTATDTGAIASITSTPTPVQSGAVAPAVSDRIAALPDAIKSTRPVTLVHSQDSAHSANKPVVATTGGGITATPGASVATKDGGTDGNGLTKPAEAEDLIADYGDPAVDGVYDFGISTNEDGLYAIKL